MPAVDRSVEKFTDKDDRHDRERLKAVELAVGQIEKQFGKGSIMRLGQKGAIQPIDFISTGSISIDYALGVGGVPEALGERGHRRIRLRERGACLREGRACAGLASLRADVLVARPQLRGSRHPARCVHPGPRRVLGWKW